MEKFSKKELLAMLPVELRETTGLTSSQKVVLAQLIVYDQLEQTKTNGYFYRTNSALMEDCDIKSEHTIIVAVTRLVILGLIERKAGSRGAGASEYRLTNKLRQYLNSQTTKYSSDCSKECSTETVSEGDIVLDKGISSIIYSILQFIDNDSLKEKLKGILREAIEQELGKEVTEAKKHEGTPAHDVSFASPVEEHQHVPASTPVLEVLQSIPATETDNNAVKVESSIPAQKDTLASPAQNDKDVSPGNDAGEVDVIPNNDELYDTWLDAFSPHLKAMGLTTSIEELDELKDNSIKAQQGFFKKYHVLDNEELLNRMARTMANRYNTRKQTLIMSSEGF